MNFKNIDKLNLIEILYVAFAIFLLILLILNAESMDVLKLNPTVSYQSLIGTFVLLAILVERFLNVFILGKINTDIKMLQANNLQLKTLETLENLQRKEEEKDSKYVLFSILIGLLLSACGFLFLSQVACTDVTQAGACSLSLEGNQQIVFKLLDILLSAALIGGGSKGIETIFKKLNDANTT